MLIDTNRAIARRSKVSIIDRYLHIGISKGDIFIRIVLRTKFGSVAPAMNIMSFDRISYIIVYTKLLNFNHQSPSRLFTT